MNKYLFKNKLLLATLVLLTIGVSLGNICFSLLLKVLIDIAQQKSIEQFYRVGQATIIFILLYAIIKYLREIFQSKYNRKFITNLRTDIFNNILHAKSIDLEEKNKNLNISILINDINMIEQDYIGSIFDIISCSIGLVLSLIIMIKTSIIISLTIIVFSLLPIIVTMFFSNRISKSKVNYSNELGIFTTKIKEYLSGIEVIKSFNVESKINSEFNNSNYKLESYKYKYKKVNTMSNTICETISSSIFLVALGIGSSLAIKNKISIGDMILCVQLLNYIVSPLNIIPRRLNNLNSVKLIWSKIKGILEKKEIETYVLENKVNFNNSLELIDIEFKYDELTVLKNINLNIEKGKKYAIVGQSGSGKSTILKLLLRQYNPTSGSILIDGVNYNKLYSHDFYNLISIVQQDVFMFDETVKNNITLYKNYPQDKICKIVEMAGLSNMIERLDNGLESKVGDNGSKFSGGERQRISIARALIKETPILLLDEITSALDKQISYNIEKTLMGIEDLTCVVVTHRLDESILKLYDSIIVMKNGEIVENNSFDKLIENRGYFYSLFNVYSDDDPSLCVT